MPKLTIHTATYNRAYILPKAYESLKAQTCKDFEWIITDDGSTDDTETLVNSWIAQDNGFEIVYNKLSHVGIPRALNAGVNKASTDWFMMLDSDDAILPTTVEKVLVWIDEIKDDLTFAGIGFTKCFPDGRYMRDMIPIIDKTKGYTDATNAERKYHNLNMDMNEAYRIKCLKKYPFLVWEGEYYAPEQLAFNNMSLAGLKIRWRDEKLYICDYLPDGQTKDDKLVKRNPMGFAMMYNQNILFSESLKEKINNVLQMSALAMYARNPSYIFKSNAKALSLVLLPFSFALSLRRKRQYKQLGE